MTASYDRVSGFDQTRIPARRATADVSGNPWASRRVRLGGGALLEELERSAWARLGGVFWRGDKTPWRVCSPLEK